MSEPIRPKRVSMAYVLGFSNKPFKEDKPLLPLPLPPPPQLPRRSPFTDAGGLFEWTASDGRKGKLTGRGRPRLAAANVAKVPSEKQQSKPASNKSASKKAIAEAVLQAVEETGGLMGLFDDTPAAEEEKKPEASAVFTAEQDKTLVDMKNSSNKWADIATKLGKDTNDCKERFKLIKPAGWPNDKGGNQKKEQNEGDNKSKNQRKQSQEDDKKDYKKDDKQEDKKDEKNNADANDNANNGGTNKENTSNDANNNTDGFIVPNMWGDSAKLPGNTEESTDTGKGAQGWDKDEGAATGATEDLWAATDGAADSAWPAADGAADAQNTDNANAAWGTTNDAWHETPTGNKTPSKASSKTPSKKSTPAAQTTTSPPAPAPEPFMYEITPDAVFSADDLRTIARILQQDAKMVWDRVSWRFRDKTGRHVEPDVFEEKITGRVEGREKGA